MSDIDMHNQHPVPDTSQPSNESDIDHDTAIIHQQMENFQQQYAQINNSISKRVWGELVEFNPTLINFASFLILLSASIQDWPALEKNSNWLTDRWILEYWNTDPYIQLLRKMANELSLDHDITRPVKYEYLTDFNRITNAVFSQSESRAKFISSLYYEIQEKGEDLVALPETFSFNGVKLLYDRYHQLSLVFFNDELEKPFPTLDKLLRRYQFLRLRLEFRIKEWCHNAYQWLNHKKNNNDMSITENAISTSRNIRTIPTPMDEKDTLFFEIYSILEDLHHLKPIMVNLLHSIQILSRLGVGPLLIFPAPSTVPVKVALQFLSEEELARINYEQQMTLFHHNPRKPYRSYTQTLTSGSGIAS